ncbi:MAG: hypothetical protein JWO38_4856 [Gemmataceae bacterium]|nr:hypothetical protein [Gemmataceae bacterium]
MPTPSKEYADEVLIRSLARGDTIPDAARVAQVSERTGFRRLANPTFRDRLSATQAAALSPAYGMLTTGLTDACFKLTQLVRHAKPHVGFKAAKAVVDLTLKMREQVELEDRVTGLERITKHKARFGQYPPPPEDDPDEDDPGPDGPGGPGGPRTPPAPGAGPGVETRAPDEEKQPPGLPNTDKHCHDPIPGPGPVGERPERACTAGTSAAGLDDGSGGLPSDRRKKMGRPHAGRLFSFASDGAMQSRTVSDRASTRSHNFEHSNRSSSCGKGILRGDHAGRDHRCAVPLLDPSLPAGFQAWK